MSDISTQPNPVRTGAHSRAGIAAILVFQLIVMVFAILLAGANLWPAIFPDATRAEGYALKFSIYLTLPLAVVGVILGIVGIMQETRRRKFAVVGLSLCAIHALICLFVLRG